ncbi:hypothetical protein SUGI_1182210 [Cryptomeria japonica]|uniref:probable calcium-binding protein CML10 n=1 Tax=Cryptomeria japonica TaxID=3369 RepID=UPI002414AD3B|nr:probable calcium-binding protein CML10 [Cryptomeria japonica]GLJ55078.1 hypothetical protein SUGI_1182210 [Cryptomeria japonica]
MGFPWFSNRKNVPIESPRRQSEGINIFSSESRPRKSSSPKKMSGRKERQNSSKDCIVRIPCPLPSSEELQNVFNKFDANSDGKISPSELGHVMRSLGHDATEDEVQLMMAEADSDGDGYVDSSEFVALNTRGVDSAASLRDLKDAFNMFDIDGSGSISADELHRVLRRLGETSSLDECHHIIRGVDADGDGQVSFNEFFTMMSNPVAVQAN